jgi:hypothetical protein
MAAASGSLGTDSYVVLSALFEVSVDTVDGELLRNTTDQQLRPPGKRGRHTCRSAFALRVWKPLTSPRVPPPTLDFSPFHFGGIVYEQSEAYTRGGRTELEGKVALQGDRVMPDVSSMRYPTSKSGQMVLRSPREDDAKETR